MQSRDWRRDREQLESAGWWRGAGWRAGQREAGVSVGDGGRPVVSVGDGAQRRGERGGDATKTGEQGGGAERPSPSVGGGGQGGQAQLAAG